MWARLIRAKQNITDPVERAQELEDAANTPDLPTTRAGWHCPGDHCMKRYKKDHPGSQIFFTADLDMVRAMELQNVEYDVNRLPITMYRLDELDSSADNKIHILKAARLLRKFRAPDGTWRQITYKSILSHIAKFNEDTDRRLRAAFPENVWVRVWHNLGYPITR